MDEKRPMSGLFCDDPKTPEGKYLVKRRDGTVLAKPHFVLVATDPMAVMAMYTYADEVDRICRDNPDWAARLGISPEFATAVRRRADFFEQYRVTEGDSDPGMGRHRKDDPATIEEMRRAMSS